MRTPLVSAVIAALPSVVHADFIGIEIREDKMVTQAALDAGLASDVRVFNFFSKTSDADLGGQLLNIGADPLGSGETIRLNTARHPNAAIYQAPAPYGVTVGAPSVDSLALDPRVEFDSYVSIGLKQTPPGFSDPTSADPDFTAPGGGFTPTSVNGGWFVAGFPAQAQPALNTSTGEYEVFFLQLAVTGLEPGGVLFEGAADDPSASVLSHFDAVSSIFLGAFDVFVLDNAGGGPGRTRIVIEDIPAPATGLVFGGVSAAFGRRSRRSV